jgi:hypothetical protein
MVLLKERGGVLAVGQKRGLIGRAEQSRKDGITAWGGVTNDGATTQQAHHEQVITLPWT